MKTLKELVIIITIAIIAIIGFSVGCGLSKLTYPLFKDGISINK